MSDNEFEDIAELALAPYGEEVELTPQDKTKKKLFSPSTPSSVNNSSNSYNFSSISNSNEKYDAGIDYDDRTISSMASSQLSIDGNLLQSICYAPAGKLGIAIDTVNGHPVVHRVRGDSPLVGVLRRLDVIAAIDDEDTIDMSAGDVTTLMARKMDQRRKITFLRGKGAVEALRHATI